MSLKPPHAALALTDAPRALADAAILGLAAPLLRKMPRGRASHSVMVIPGFLGDDRGNKPLVRFLRSLGYTATGWRQGRNLGSPLGKGHANASHPSRLYRRLNPQTNPHDAEEVLSVPPPVPTTAIYTKADGVVNWRTSRQEGDHKHVHNIEVLGSHIGLNLNAAVWYWIAKKLSQI